MWERRDTHRPQQALRFLNGTVTSEEAHQHHHSPDGYQYVHTCKHTHNHILAQMVHRGNTVSLGPQGGSTARAECACCPLIDPHIVR